MTRPLAILKIELFKRLDAATGVYPSGGEQKLLISQSWADEALKAGEFDRFLRLLEDHREAKSADAATSAGRESGEGSKRRRASTRGRPRADDPDDLRALILARQVMRTVAKDVYVERFRAQCFGSPVRVISDAEAAAFLGSPALRLLEKATLEEKGVPILDHRAALKLDDRGSTRTARWEVGRVEIEWGRRRRFFPVNACWEIPPPRILRCEGFGSIPESLWVYQDSWLDSLRAAAHHVALGWEWTDANAVRFILTGYGPVPAPLRTTSTVNLSGGASFQSAVIEVHAQPFVSPKDVAASFAREQRKLLGHRKGPAIQESNLRLLDFVLGRISALGKLPPWETLRRAWNREVKSAWRYSEADAAHIRNDFNRTREAVLHPGYERTLAPGVKYRLVPVKPKGRGKPLARRRSRLPA
jgi:hypothetical protein